MCLLQLAVGHRSPEWLSRFLDQRGVDRQEAFPLMEVAPQRPDMGPLECSQRYQFPPGGWFQTCQKRQARHQNLLNTGSYYQRRVGCGRRKDLIHLVRRRRRIDCRIRSLVLHPGPCKRQGTDCFHLLRRSSCHRTRLVFRHSRRDFVPLGRSGQRSNQRINTNHLPTVRRLLRRLGSHGPLWLSAPV